MNEQQRMQWIFERLKHSLQALALPASAQVSLFPDLVVKTDELLLDFDHWRLCALGNHSVEMSKAQYESLAAIDAHVAAPSTERAVGDESALGSHPFWRQLRVLAKESLDAFGWPLEQSPSYAHEYVRGKES